MSVETPTSPVQVTKHLVDWSSLSTGPALRLNETLLNQTSGYFNPAYSVIPLPGTSDADFYRSACQALIKWTRTLNQVLGGPSRRKRAFRNAPYMTQRLEFLGVLVLRGQIMKPHDWAGAPKRGKYASRKAS